MDVAAGHVDRQHLHACTCLVDGACIVTACNHGFGLHGNGVVLCQLHGKVIKFGQIERGSVHERNRRTVALYADLFFVDCIGQICRCCAFKHDRIIGGYLKSRRGSTAKSDFFLYGEHEIRICRRFFVEKRQQCTAAHAVIECL